MWLIDADELKKRAVKVRFPDIPDCGEFDAVGVSDIDIMPTIDPESLRPTAHWIKRGHVCGENEYECSACHQTEWRTSANRMKYCMFCGADNVIVLIFWPLLVVTRIGIACYRIIRRLLK